MSTFRVRVENLRIKPAVTAGMNPYVLMALAGMMRSTTEDPPPALVAKEGDHWRIQDGRHRFFAAVLAGRPDLLCAEEPTHG